jgi:hypothetical protein
MKRHALPIAFALVVAAPHAVAQSSVATINGKAESGNTVSVENIETGHKREMTVPKNGRFKFRALPTGTYDVLITEPDGDVVKSQYVTLRAGGGASVRQDPIGTAAPDDGGGPGTKRVPTERGEIPAERPTKPGDAPREFE